MKRLFSILPLLSVLLYPAAATPLPASSPAPAVIGAEEMAKSIQEVIRQREYTWRVPREDVPKPETAKADEQSYFSQMVDWVVGGLKSTFKAIGSVMDEIDRLVDKLLGKRLRPPTPDGAKVQTDWLSPLRVLVVVLCIALLVVISVFAWRAWKRRQHHRTKATTVVAKQAVPDLRDDNVVASDLPGDEWLRLAQTLLAQGELRLALRAHYLASLAALGEKQLITLTKYKSNHEYARELSRRTHVLPEVTALFETQVLVFDRAWYGLHEVTRDMLSEFAQRTERIRAA
ncbi:MAG: DUF4129 domain-containing protein [Verrucomicrobiota bacterium]